MRTIRELLIDRWAEYLLEVIVIILGIIIAFWLQAWEDNRRQEKRSMAYLQELHSDFLQNERLMNSAIDQLYGTMSAVQNLASFIEYGFIQDSGIELDTIWSDVPSYMHDDIPITDTLSLFFNLNRSGFITNYDLILPAWQEIISTGALNLIKNGSIKKDIAELYMSYEELEKLEEKIIMPASVAFQALRAKYYDVSATNTLGMPEFGISGTRDQWVDIDALRNSKEIEYHLRRVYRAANEHKSLIEIMVGYRTKEIMAIIEKELSKRK